MPNTLPHPFRTAFVKLKSLNSHWLLCLPYACASKLSFFLAWLPLLFALASVARLLRLGTRGMLNSPGLTSTSLRCSARLGCACRREKRVEPENPVEAVEVEDMVEDFSKRGSESKEVARATLRVPDMLGVEEGMEPWVDEVSFCARRVRREDKSRAEMEWLGFVIGDVLVVYCMVSTLRMWSTV